ncbi:MAG: Mrp/NBP35 family ATP-binding protein [Solitalea-like symbiont of Acarus siro]
MISKEQIIGALSKVYDPDLKKDLVSLNMIDNIQVNGNKISFTVLLTTPACPLKQYIKSKCEKAIKELDPNVDVEVTMSSRVSGMQKTDLANIKNIILVSSGKGGVGKSTVAANIAVGLANIQGLRVALLDADIYGPSIPIMFGKQNTQAHAIKTVDGKNRIEPIESYGIKMLSMGFFVQSQQAVPWRGPMVSSAIKQFIYDTDWGEIDYLIIDMPPGTGDIHLTIAQQVPISGAIIVTTPQNIASSDARKGLTMFLMKNIEVNILGVVENMSYFIDNSGHRHNIFGTNNGGEALAKEFQVPFLGQIPIFSDINKACDEGRPISLEKDHDAAKIFEDIASKIACSVSVINTNAKMC